MMPKKSTSATLSNSHPRRKLARRWLSSFCACAIARLHHHRRLFEGVIRRRRRQRPLQGIRAFPRFRRGRRAALDALHYDEKEQDLRQAKTKGAYGGNRVPVGKLQRIVGNAAWH